MNAHSGLCLSAAGGGQGKNVPIVQFTCDMDPSRRWHYNVVDATTIRLVNKHHSCPNTLAMGTRHVIGEFAGALTRQGRSPCLANLSCYRWQKHCRGLYETTPMFFFY